eukprot:CAMPEP_0172454242 /NCGR_PEP_ID=MMETSP1065-20121228/11291_1 /TAXON_ID=265537 /ORGANISM="Amphiprora paludosa, Strain CCMP125" /LENGTH=136 /DNA_ID=CAMNT_0013206535 /DNA_START=66 /DNA_END=473 /DNA_ORIENTATION=-
MYPVAQQKDANDNDDEFTTMNRYVDNIRSAFVEKLLFKRLRPRRQKRRSRKKCQQTAFGTKLPDGNDNNEANAHLFLDAQGNSPLHLACKYLPFLPFVIERVVQSDQGTQFAMCGHFNDDGFIPLHILCQVASRDW